MARARVRAPASWREPGFHRRPSSVRAAALLGWFQARGRADGRPARSSWATGCAPTSWGRGYATEGAAALLADALARPGRRARVYAHALLSNPGSIRVMEKIGMTYAGPWDVQGACRAPSTRRRRRAQRDRPPPSAPERPRAAPHGRPGSFLAALPGRSARGGMRAAVPRMCPVGRDAAMGPRGDRPGTPGPHRCAQGRAVRMGRGDARRDRAGSRSRRPHPSRRTRGRGRWCSSRAWRRRRPGRRRAGRSRAMRTRPAGGSRQGRTCVREPRPGVGRKRGAASELAAARPRGLHGRAQRGPDVDLRAHARDDLAGEARRGRVAAQVGRAHAGGASPRGPTRRSRARRARRPA